MNIRWKLVGCFLTAATLLAGAGCGSASPASAGPRYELLARTIPGAGRVLTDGQGFTLYIYVPDHRGHSRCSGVCARDWPPLTLPAGTPQAVAGQGAQARLLGTVRRAGGARQVTYNGWPLYLWQGDHEPGQATGQADDMGLWYMLTPRGTVDTRQVSGAAAGT
jgi:predicted lipoprotein with Yx(FWY)xxD motif